MKKKKPPSAKSADLPSFARSAYRLTEPLDARPLIQDPTKTSAGRPPGPHPTGGLGGRPPVDEPCNRVNYEQDCAHDDSVLFNPEEADNTVWEDFMVPDFDTKDEQRLDLFGGLDKEIKNLIKAESPSSEAFLDDKELLLPYSALLLPPQDNHSHQTPSYKLETSPPLLGEGKIPPPELSDNIEILESKWASHGQLVTFRKTATKIAEDYLEDQGIKLVNRPARSNAIQDSGAYKQGRKDGRKIDVRRKGISN
ncbi:Ankyrin repeat protein [Apiospora kogelbergensis]|uniref:Ankyrin repeat protein n=1 Tax=Apiospora kogelbergensis TaxID=1337665 RepID=UPI00313233D0